MDSVLLVAYRISVFVLGFAFSRALGAYPIENQSCPLELVTRSLSNPAPDPMQVAIFEISNLVAICANEVGVELGIRIIVPLVIANIADFTHQSQS